MHLDILVSVGDLKAAVEIPLILALHCQCQGPYLGCAVLAGGRLDDGLVLSWLSVSRGLGFAGGSTLWQGPDESLDH